MGELEDGCQDTDLKPQACAGSAAHGQKQPTKLIVALDQPHQASSQYANGQGSVELNFDEEEELAGFLSAPESLKVDDDLPLAKDESEAFFALADCHLSGGDAVKNSNRLRFDGPTVIGRSVTWEAADSLTSTTTKRISKSYATSYAGSEFSRPISVDCRTRSRSDGFHLMRAQDFYSMQTAVSRTPNHFFHARSSEALLDECRIPKLDFMDAEGMIFEPPSAFERAFGSRIMEMKNCLASCLSCCPPNKGTFGRFIKGGPFKLVSASVIVLNFVFIVMQSDYSISHLHKEDTPEMTMIGYCFTAFYTLELLLQIVADGRDFLLGGEVAWNMFDASIVIVAWVEICIKMLGAAMVNTSFLRILRFFKISRVLRMFSAMRMFKEIRIMVDSLVGCLSIFLFCSMILALFLCVFAIFFVQGVATYLETAGEVDEDLRTDIYTYFGSVGQGMLTLYMAATNDWITFYELVIQHLGLKYKALYVAFITFYMVALFNVITGTFCEKAISLASPTTHELIHRRFEKEVSDAKELMSLLSRVLDDDGSRAITADDFARLIADPEVQIYFEVRGLKPTSALKFFTTLCEVHQTDNMDFATFVSNCVKLDGVSSSIDMHVQGVRQMRLHEQLLSIHHAQHAELKEMYDLTQKQLAEVGRLLNHERKTKPRKH